MNWPPRSRSEEIAAAAAKAYTSEKAANRCALEGLESKRALEAEQAAHAATRAELSRALAEKSTAPTTEPPTAEPASEPELTTEPI
jgi:hypothetical protein